ncbi:MAG TPA: toll/interleukin-1 receptor domain-containing protein [Draconibacterium sp.]|nr:toll/interleukin-1 receptor domain-containing protein [Draconibacterium sp.]
MKLLSQIIVHRQQTDAKIQLLHGDLTAISPENATDILVVSAFPGSYVPSDKTLMAALYHKGVLVGEMAKDKEIDLRSQLGCWLSKPLSEEQQKQFHFKQILCFEPGNEVHEDKTVVGNIFRCINAFAFEKQNNIIAMPVVASGNQKVSFDKMLPAIVEAAIFWLENGLPLQSLKLVLYSDEQVAEGFALFEKIKQDYEFSVRVKEKPDDYSTFTKNLVQKSFREISKIQENELFIEGIDGDVSGGIDYPIAEKSDDSSTKKEDSYDLFISYAHTHSDLINSFVEHLKQKNNRLKIFYDKDSIPPGGLWIKQISDTIQKSKKVLVFLSPDYDKSPVCWDEFQCAKLLEYNRKKSVIQTIYLYKYEDEMPLIMGIYSYLDCREGDIEKLKAAIPKLVG